jgi:hypothetical protein
MNNNDWKPKLLAAGTLIGAIVGLTTAFLLARAAEEDNGTLEISTSDLLKVTLSIVGTMRGVAALGHGR